MQLLAKGKTNPVTNTSALTGGVKIRFITRLRPDYFTTSSLVRKTLEYSFANNRLGIIVNKLMPY